MGAFELICRDFNKLIRLTRLVFLTGAKVLVCGSIQPIKKDNSIARFLGSTIGLDMTGLILYHGHHGVPDRGFDGSKDYCGRSYLIGSWRALLDLLHLLLLVDFDERVRSIVVPSRILVHEPPGEGRQLGRNAVQTESILTDLKFFFLDRKCIITIWSARLLTPSCVC